MNEKERLLSFLGIARRAQKLSMGADAAQEAMQKGKTKLLLLASDLSERPERSARAEAQAASTPVLPAGVTMDEIAFSVGKRTGILAVNDSGFAGKLRTMLGEQQDAPQGPKSGTMLEEAAPAGMTEEVDSIDD